MTQHYSSFGEAAGAAMAHNARMAARHAIERAAADPAVFTVAADAIDAETAQLRADGVLEPGQYRPCRDAAAQLREIAATGPTPADQTAAGALLHLVDRAEDGRLLPGDAQRLRGGIRAMTATAPRDGLSSPLRAPQGSGDGRDAGGRDGASGGRTADPDAEERRQRYARALRTTPATGHTHKPGQEKWDHHPAPGSEGGHRYTYTCALCRGDIDALTDAVLAVAAAEQDEVRAERDRYAAAVGRAEQYAHQLRHGDAMGLLAALDAPQAGDDTTEETR